MKKNIVLDATALHCTADGSPAIERQLLLRFIETADRCLERMHGLVMLADAKEWRAEVRELENASRGIHANQLATLCKEALDTPVEPGLRISKAESVSRMTAYLGIHNAFETFVTFLRHNDMLTPDVIPGKSQGG